MVTLVREKRLKEYSRRVPALRDDFWYDTLQVI